MEPSRGVSFNGQQANDQQNDQQNNTAVPANGQHINQLVQDLLVKLEAMPQPDPMAISNALHGLAMLAGPAVAPAQNLQNLANIVQGAQLNGQNVADALKGLGKLAGPQDDV